MIPVLYQNNDFIVVNKPEGVNFHSENTPGLVVLMQQQLGIKQFYPVHRLDKMTSGLLVLALNKTTAHAFQVLFESRQVEKFYLAISDHKPKKKQGGIKGDMLPARRGSWMLAKTMNNPAITQFISTLIKPGERLYLLKPKTGKTHQLRVAMKSLAAPICGDERYSETTKAKQEQRGYLHAYALRFTLHQQHYEFICPPTQGERFAQLEVQNLLQAWQKPWQNIETKPTIQSSSLHRVNKI